MAEQSLPLGATPVSQISTGLNNSTGFQAHPNNCSHTPRTPFPNNYNSQVTKFIIIVS